jgi:hypothetical protein
MLREKLSTQSPVVQLPSARRFFPKRANFCQIVTKLLSPKHFTQHLLKNETERVWKRDPA